MSQSKIYVGNLSYSVNQEQLNSFFGQFGDVTEATVIMDRATNRSKGFGFVTFATADAAQAALQSNGQDLGGRALKVSLAKEDGGERRPRTGGFGGGNGGGDRRPRTGGFGGGNGGGGNRW